VWAESDREDRLRVLGEVLPVSAGRGIPEGHPTVLPARRDPLAIRAEGEAVTAPDVSPTAELLLSRPRIPYLDGVRALVALRTLAAGGQALAIRAEGHPTHEAGVAAADP